MQTFTDISGRRRTADEVLDIFNRGADELHRQDGDIRLVNRSTAQSIEEGRWIGEGFSQKSLSHHPTWLGGNRDIRVVADDGSHLWLRWDTVGGRYRIMERERPLPFYTYGRTVMDMPQTEDEFLRLEEEYRSGG